MKEMRLLMVLSAALLLMTDMTYAQSADDGKEGYRLVFSDEFNGPDNSQPDASKWSRCRRGLSTWDRLMCDDERVAVVRSGALHLRAIPNRDLQRDTAKMLTGGIETKDKFSFQYGRVEVRLKTKRHAGNFPATWMMPQPPAEDHPKGGEIDIFETIDTERTSYHTIHSYWTNVVAPQTSHERQFRASLNVSRWHVYAFEWTPAEMSYYVDGVYLGTYRKSGDPHALANGQWPFDHPFYLILNQAVGNGSWAKNYDPTYSYETQIDWVRVYQKE
ncbi:MAG: glycoside hydrolase family 16 protein [Prevotella sp.]|nr:glycoside hydrolase family 16 protein [Prevotella sp.]